MNRRILSISIMALWGAFSSGCQTPAVNGITQVATIDALLAGVYDGHTSLETLRRHGDFGIGTFAGLDGEMVLLDGRFYQIRSDGKVYQPPLSDRTPFACVTTFVPDRSESITSRTDMKALQERIDTLAPGQNSFCTFIVRGVFSHVRVRSVPAQTKPYRPLAEVTKNQPVFILSKIRGALIGFRSPSFVKGVNVPGYHIHFLADDLSGGGHILEFELTQGLLEADTVHEWLNIYLPSESVSFGAADLTQERSKELEGVEK